jgi:hypothetical protein
MDIGIQISDAIIQMLDVAQWILYPAAVALGVYIAFRLWWDGVARFFNR